MVTRWWILGGRTALRSSSDVPSVFPPLGDTFYKFNLDFHLDSHLITLAISVLWPSSSVHCEETRFLFNKIISQNAFLSKIWKMVQRIPKNLWPFETIDYGWCCSPNVFKKKIKNSFRSNSDHLLAWNGTIVPFEVFFKW